MGGKTKRTMQPHGKAHLTLVPRQILWAGERVGEICHDDSADIHDKYCLKFRHFSHRRNQFSATCRRLLQENCCSCHEEAVHAYRLHARSFVRAHQVMMVGNGVEGVEEAYIVFESVRSSTSRHSANSFTLSIMLVSNSPLIPLTPTTMKRRPGLLATTLQCSSRIIG